jgi:hypothetical protein
MGKRPLIVIPVNAGIQVFRGILAPDFLQAGGASEF